MKDVRDMTIRELGELADQINSLDGSDSTRRRLNDKMAIASLLLADSGALSQLLWWARDVEPEGPPESRARLFVMRHAPQSVQ